MPNEKSSGRSEAWNVQYEAWYAHLRDDESKPKGYRPKPQSDENRTKEQVERKYVSRSNTCPNCNTVRSTKDGSCWC